MKIKKTILFTLTSAFLFTGCGGLSDAKKAITNQKETILKQTEEKTNYE